MVNKYSYVTTCGLYCLLSCAQAEKRAPVKDKTTCSKATGQFAKKALNPFIVGGQSVASSQDTRAASTVYIGIGTSENSEKICTGVLLSENLVATAAHCFELKNAAEKITYVTLKFGLDVSNASQTTTKYADTYKIHPRYPSPTSPSYDIAWIKFSGGIPVEAHPVAIWTRLNDVVSQEPIWLTGYGKTGTKKDTSNQLLMVDTIFNRIASANEMPGTYGILVYGPKPNKGVCYGDSGGPSYLKRNGTWYALGVTEGFVSQYFPSIINPQDNAICEYGASVFTALVAHRVWLESSSGVKLTTQPGGESDMGQETPSISSTKSGQATGEPNTTTDCL